MTTKKEGIEFDSLDLFVDEELEKDVLGETLEPLEALGVETKASVSPRLSDIESLITEVDDSVEYLTWLIYGKNGTGKTTLLSTVEGMLILAAEDGTLSIKDLAKGKALKIKIDSWEKLEGVYWLLANGVLKKNKAGKIEGIEIKTKAGKFLVKSLGFDTLTKLVDVCMRNIVLGEKEKDLDKDILKKTLRNWGDMNEKMRYWLQLFQELPLQKVWLCQENANAEDLEADEYTIYPALNKGLRTYVQSEADIIARTYIAKGKDGTDFRLSALPNPTFVSKDRTRTLTGAINNPDLSKLYNLVFK